MVVRVEDVADRPAEFVVVPPVTRIPEDTAVGQQVMQGQWPGQRSVVRRAVIGRWLVMQG